MEGNDREASLICFNFNKYSLLSSVYPKHYFEIQSTGNINNDNLHFFFNQVIGTCLKLDRQHLNLGTLTFKVLTLLSINGDKEGLLGSLML